MVRRTVAHYSTDLGDLPAGRASPENTDPVTRRWTDRFGAIAEAATAWPWPGIPMESAVPCWGREAKGPCTGFLNVVLTGEGARIDWECPRCEMGGVLTHWQGTVFDLAVIPLETSRPPEEWPRVALHFLEHDLLVRLPDLAPSAFRILRSAEWMNGEVRITAPLTELRRLLAEIVRRFTWPKTRRDRLLLGSAFHRLGRALAPPANRK